MLALDIAFQKCRQGKGFTVSRTIFRLDREEPILKVLGFQLFGGLLT